MEQYTDYDLESIKLLPEGLFPGRHPGVQFLFAANSAEPFSNLAEGLLILEMQLTAHLCRKNIRFKLHEFAVIIRQISRYLKFVITIRTKAIHIYIQ